MSNKSNVLIVGAGITGIASALYCHRRGISSELHEARSTIGGVLRDWIVGDDWYFRNCQYLTPSEAWYKLLPKAKLFTFPHTYGSYTDLWDEVCINYDFAGPVYSLYSPLGEPKSAKSVSLLDRLNLYPDEIAQPLIEWVLRFIDNPQDIHYSGVDGLALSRVYPLHFADEIYNFKKSSKLADEIYGLPRNYLRLPPKLAAFPCDGFTDYFEHVKIHLESKINLRLNSSISANSFTGGNLDGQEVPFIIWSSSPTTLLHQLKLQPLNSRGFRMRNVVLKWPFELFDTPFYIQVYSKILSITRIFVYMNKATIECFSDKVSTSDIVLSGLEVLNSFFENIGNPHVYHEFKEIRYFLFTIKDFYRLQGLATDLPALRFIPSQWHVFGRDAKINLLYSCIEKKIGFL